MSYFDGMESETESWPNNFFSSGIGDSPAAGGNWGGLMNFFKDPKKMAGLSALGSALAKAGAPSATPQGWGGALSQALSGYQAGKDGYDQMQHRDKMQSYQLDAQRAQAQQQEAERMQQLRCIANGGSQDFCLNRRY
jgi:hypothetical protein